LAFIDADHEVERAAGCSIAGDLRAPWRGPNFRDGERRVISRLLDIRFMCWQRAAAPSWIRATRALIGERAISIWLRASSRSAAAARVARRNDRP